MSIIVKKRSINKIHRQRKIFEQISTKLLLSHHMHEGNNNNNNDNVIINSESVYLDDHHKIYLWEKQLLIQRQRHGIR